MPNGTIEILTLLHPAYIAGIVDGEGCLTLVTSRGGGGGYSTIRPVLAIANTNRDLLEAVRNTLDAGAVNIMRGGRIAGVHRMGWQYQATGRATLHRILTMIRPYLVLKAAQADVILQFIADNKTMHNPIPPDVLAHRQAAIAQIRELNRKGSR